jgi:hypothetical protein
MKTADLWKRKCKLVSSEGAVRYSLPARTARGAGSQFVRIQYRIRLTVAYLFPAVPIAPTKPAAPAVPAGPAVPIVPAVQKSPNVGLRNL